MSIVGAVLGVSEVTAAILSTAGRLAIGARQVDDGTAARMVALMQGRVPVQSGALRGGIGWERDGDSITVKATAVAGKAQGRLGADYASFVEFGTDPRAPSRRVADADYFAGASRGHPGTDARSYFWPAVREVLPEWRERQQRMADDAAAGLEAA